MIDPNFYTTQHIELEVAELDIDEGLKDCILTTLERYEQLKAKIAEIDTQEPAFYAAKDEIEAIGSSCNSCLLFKSKDEPNFTIPFYAIPVQQSPAISKMETTANGLNLRLIEDCLLIYKTQLYFDDYSELRNKVTDQINILAKLNKQGA